MTSLIKKPKQRKIASVMIQDTLVNTLSGNQTLTTENSIKTPLQDYYLSLSNQTPPNSLTELIQSFEELSISEGLNFKKDSSPMPDYGTLSDIVLTSFTNLLRKESSKQLIQKAKTKQDLKTILLIDQLPQQEIDNAQDLNIICISLLRSSYSARKLKEFAKVYEGCATRFEQYTPDWFKPAARERYQKLQEINSVLFNSLSEIRNLQTKVENPKLEDLSKKIQELKAKCNNQFSLTVNKVIEELKQEQVQIKPTLEEQITYLTDELRLVKSIRADACTEELNGKIKEIEGQLEKSQNLNEQFKNLKQESTNLTNILSYLQKITVSGDYSLPKEVYEWYDKVKKINPSLLSYERYDDVSKITAEHRDLVWSVQRIISEKMHTLHGRLSYLSGRLLEDVNKGEYLIKDNSFFKKIDHVRLEEYKRIISHALDGCRPLEKYVNQASKTRGNLEVLLQKLGGIKESKVVKYILPASKVLYEGLKYSANFAIKSLYCGLKHGLYPLMKLAYKYPKHALSLSVIGAASYFGYKWYQNESISFYDLKRAYSESRDINSLRKNLPDCIQIKYINNNDLPDLYKPKYGVLIDGRHPMQDSEYLREIVKNPLTNFPPRQ